MGELHPNHKKSEEKPPKKTKNQQKDKSLQRKWRNHQLLTNYL